MEFGFRPIDKPQGKLSKSTGNLSGGPSAVAAAAVAGAEAGAVALTETTRETGGAWSLPHCLSSSLGDLQQASVLQTASTFKQDPRQVEARHKRGDSLTPASHPVGLFSGRGRVSGRRVWVRVEPDKELVGSGFLGEAVSGQKVIRGNMSMHTSPPHMVTGTLQRTLLYITFCSRFLYPEACRWEEGAAVSVNRCELSGVVTGNAVINV
ncbi:hypothetical protein E2C01_019931 [Portunus trituberculatus]|uniref:Uncharacterized protein n=1 Tax=Portunus trituberculatus TaxID=210409 RepID=A0A5B7E0R2_PORTR|nr:hypothetical protein [Portunus trituberculatus]